MTDKIGPTRLFRNRKTGERFLAAKELNDDVIYAVMDENDKLINTGNRFPKDEFIGILVACEMEEKIDMNSGFYSTDSIFHEWCLDYFNYMWQIVKPFNPNKLNEV